jgi:hypothetical protein
MLGMNSASRCTHIHEVRADWPVEGLMPMKKRQTEEQLSAHQTK